MGPLNLFKLEKLKIEVYGNRLRIGLPKDTLKVMFNPESYALSYQNVYEEQQSIGSGSSSARYQMSKPANLSLKIIFDGTGVSEQGVLGLLAKKEVETEVQHFLKAVFSMDSQLHEPKFLKVLWGTLNFDCRIDDVTINYSLFDQSGKPLRAELDTSFINDIEAGKRPKKEKLSSPDLTHKRIVKEHDTLPLLCQSIYGTTDYYLQVAKANGLADFRNLTPGQELFFPPIKN